MTRSASVSEAIVTAYEPSGRRSGITSRLLDEFPALRTRFKRDSDDRISFCGGSQMVLPNRAFTNGSHANSSSALVWHIKGIFCFKPAGGAALSRYFAKYRVRKTIQDTNVL